MKKIKFYRDFEEKKKHEIKESLQLTPLERISHVVAMIKKIYPSQKSILTKRIHFRK